MMKLAHDINQYYYHWPGAYHIPPTNQEIKIIWSSKLSHENKTTSKTEYINTHQDYQIRVIYLADY